LECQFQIGYKGLIDLAYRNGQIQTIQAQAVYEHDFFEYEYGLEPRLVHKPAFSDRGEVIYFYAIFKTVNGGFGMAVMSKADMDLYAKTYSKAFDSSYSPWKTDYESMAKKTVIKQALKYAPIKTDFQRALSTDETIKKEISEDMFSVRNEEIELVA
jgi:recombination protein RecT